MKKRFLSLMLAAALLLLLAACAASPKTPVPKSSTPQESGLPSVTTEPTEPAPDYDAQLRLLADAHAQWVKTDPMGNYSYCVADLDQNGRLEVLVTICSGTGMFSRTDIWEVSEALDGVKLCDASALSEDNQPDLVGVRETTAYFDGQVYRYLFTDDIRQGAAESDEVLYALMLSGGSVQTEPLASARKVYSPDSEEPAATYYDAGGDEFSEQEYLAAADAAFVGQERYAVRLGWKSLTREETENMDAAAWLPELQALRQAFALEKR